MKDEVGWRPQGRPLFTNWQLIRRLLGMAWTYRWSCLKVLSLQIILLALGLSGLSIIGLGVDYIRYRQMMAPAQPDAEAVEPPSSSIRGAKPEGRAKPPRWPWGLKPPDDWAPMTVIGLLSGAILLFAFLRALLNYSYALAVNRLVQGKIVVDLRAKVYDAMQRLSFRFFDGNSSGSLINRVTGDVQMVRSFVDGVIMPSIILIFSLVLYLIYMVHLHTLLTLACLASSPLLWYLSARFSRMVRPAYLKNRELFDEQLRVLSESIQGVHVVKVFSREELEAGKFEAAAKAVREQKRQIFGQISFFHAVTGFLPHINLVVMLAYGGYLVVCFDRAPDAESASRAGLSIGQLLIFTGLLQQFSGQVAHISAIAGSIQQSLTGAERIFELLDRPVEIQSPPNAIRLSRPRGHVRFERVAFRYGQGEAVLQEIDLEAPPGVLIAILGSTGSGKSTLLSLIPRFYDPSEGQVWVDGQEARRLDLDDLRRGVGVVFQESFLFSTSVAANIAFGCPDASREQIERAAKLAAAHEFIQELPEGYDTVLREGGSDLSGGQRQRLALARAIIREPAILLLDDPTAAVDSQTETEILRGMENAMAGRTTFMVAHRLSALRRADTVIVLDHGRIVQRGTHEELIQAKGHYRRAAKLQLPDPAEVRMLMGEVPGSDPWNSVL